MFSLGLAYPFVAGLTYIWIDIVKPQDHVYSAFSGLPLSMIAAVIAVIAFLFNTDKKNVRFTPVMWLIVLFALWITLTTYLADPRLDAWTKWDWAFKALAFTVFMPLVFRTRLQIEALLLTIVFAVTTTTFSAAIKTLLGSGGYGTLAILGGGNIGLGESSTLATVCVMILPLVHYLYNHTIIFAGKKYFKPGMILVAASSVVTIIGTNARTGLIAGAVLIAIYVMRSRRKTAWIVLILIALALTQALNIAGTDWGKRMSTINTYESDSSAAGRVKVWQWTIEYAADNPLGGGFNSFKFNGIQSVDNAGQVIRYDPGVFQGKAFHNIFFEVLGEQGYFGLALYLVIMFLTFRTLGRVRLFTHADSTNAWANELAKRLRDAQLAMLVGGCFIGIAYQAYVFYVVAIAVLLGNLVLPQKSNVFFNNSSTKPVATA